MSQMASIVESKSVNEPKDCAQKINQTLMKYYQLEQEMLFSCSTTENITNKFKIENGRMRPENVMLNEINADLWDRALVTALTEIDSTYFPHYNVVKNIVNYTLNSKLLNCGLVTNFFLRLLVLHPPNRTIMQDYYWFILNDKYVFLNNTNKEENNLFWCLVESLSSCVKDGDLLKGDMNYHFEKQLDNTKNQILELLKNLKRSKNLYDPEKFICQDEKLIYFDSLPTFDKCQRILIILNFVYDILEADFMTWVKENDYSSKKSRKCLFSLLLWQNKNDIGTMNSEVRKIIQIYKITEDFAVGQIQGVLKNLFVLLAEIIRRSDAPMNSFYPFVGKNSNDFAREVALKFIDRLTENPREEDILPISVLRPDWLRLLVCSKLLSHMTGKFCTSELSTVIEILGNVTKLKSRKARTTRSIRPRKKDARISKTFMDVSEDSEKLEPVLKNCYCGSFIKPGSKRSKSRLLATSVVNNRGWTKLHEAALLGHEGCVKEILKCNKRTLDVKVKGFKSLTPLMCAVLKGYPTICKMLLEHSGPELLEDISADGYKVVDFCINKEVAEVLESFEKKQESQSYQFPSSYKVMVVNLCVQFLESYFTTYRTLDVYPYISGNSILSDLNCKTNNEEVSWEHARYQSDINKNLVRIMPLLTQLIKEKHVKNYIKPVSLILGSFCSK